MEPVLPRVRLSTKLGDIVIEVHSDRAPRTAEQFLSYTDEGRYRGASFSRVVRADNDHGPDPIAIVQAFAAPTDEPIEYVPHESTAQTGLRHRNGSVSIARPSGGDGTAATFFVCIGDQPALDCGGFRVADGQGFANFGTVVSGMDIVEIIHGMETLVDAPVAVMRGQMIAQPVEILAAIRDQIATVNPSELGGQT